MQLGYIMCTDRELMFSWTAGNNEFSWSQYVKCVPVDVTAVILSFY